MQTGLCHRAALLVALSGVSMPGHQHTQAWESLKPAKCSLTLGCDVPLWDLYLLVISIRIGPNRDLPHTGDFHLRDLGAALGSSLCVLSILGWLCLSCKCSFSHLSFHWLYFLVLQPRRERTKGVRKASEKHRAARGQRAQHGTATVTQAQEQQRPVQSPPGTGRALPRRAQPPHRSSRRRWRSWR